MAAVNVTKKEVARDPDGCDIPYYVSEFVEREVGNDYDSLKKLGRMHRRRRHAKHGICTSTGHSLYQATCK